MNLPTRKALPHDVPEFVDSGAVYFLTVCGEPRCQNQFACEPAWSALKSAAQFYHKRGRWHLRLLLAMPDHVHLLASFPRHESMKQVLAGWKHYLAKKSDLHWQRDFFDHRIRAPQGFDEKAAYIRENPVRAGLTERSELWPYVWVPPEITANPTC